MVPRISGRSRRIGGAVDTRGLPTCIDMHVMTRPRAQLPSLMGLVLSTRALSIRSDWTEGLMIPEGVVVL